MVTKKTLINNSLSGLVQLVITALLTFICIPVFINKLGIELYGVFAIVSVIGNLNIFANLGLNTSLIKYISEQGKCSDSENDIFSSLLIIGAIIIPITILAFIFNRFLLIDILNIPIKYYEQTRTLLFLLLTSNFLLIIGQILTAVLDALQKMYLTNLAQLIYSIIYWGGIICVTSFGYGLKSVGWAVFIAAISWFLFVVCTFYIYWGHIKPYKLRQRFIPTAKKQLIFGGKVYTSGLIGFCNEPLFKIIVSNIFGMHIVAYLEIALKVRIQLTSIFSKLTMPLLPYLSQLTDKQSTAKLIKDLTSKIFLLVLPVCGMLFVGCEEIVSLWLRTDVFNYTVFIIGLVIPYLIFSPLTLPIYIYLTAKGHPGKTIVFQSLSVIVNICIFFMLYKITDEYTIIISNVLSYFFSYLLGLHYQNKYLAIHYRLNRLYILKIMILVLVFSAIYALKLYIDSDILKLLFVSIAIPFITVWIYKHLRIVTPNDLTRYFSDSKVANSIYKII
ncbi:lipopolysaccharide biosynthesis protein [Bacteroides salyersiae]|uniref:lipopolysaccharide biosynthesis protein n=1 Tax=Bacteroides salyersiae TaxID=291644 RepID=UPI001C8C8F16|nr:oligosaccharide flippase family protein [Bacteroides salyersiae]